MYNINIVINFMRVVYLVMIRSLEERYLVWLGDWGLDKFFWGSWCISWVLIERRSYLFEEWLKVVLNENSKISRVLRW